MAEVIQYAAITDVGLRRPHNEDCFGILEGEGLVLVADGMGGHAAGEFASGLAITEVASFYLYSCENPDRPWPFERTEALTVLENRLVCGFKLANRKIFEAATGENGRRGMGTTLVGAAIREEQICIAHVGDSRAYRIHAGTIVRLTRDHSFLEQFKEINPDMTREEEDRFPHKNVITRALGLTDDVEVDTQIHPIRPGETYLLCSDGLSGHLDDEELLELVGDASDLPAIATGLVDAANDAGGNDNITVVLVRR